MDDIKYLIRLEALKRVYEYHTHPQIISRKQSSDHQKNANWKEFGQTILDFALYQLKLAIGLSAFGTDLKYNLAMKIYKSLLHQYKINSKGTELDLSLCWNGSSVIRSAM